jgi:hypothetical protein
VFVRWFFLVGGVAFLMVALWLRELPGEDKDAMAMTFALIGFFWAGPQVVLMAAKKWRA